MEPKNTDEPDNTDVRDVVAFAGALGLGYGTGAVIHRYAVELPQQVADKNIEALIGVTSVGVFALALFTWVHYLRGHRGR